MCLLAYTNRKYVTSMKRSWRKPLQLPRWKLEYSTNTGLTLHGLASLKARIPCGPPPQASMKTPSLTFAADFPVPHPMPATLSSTEAFSVSLTVSK